MPCGTWLRTNGVNIDGAAAKVMIFDRLGKKVRPGTFGTPLVLTPFVPFQGTQGVQQGQVGGTRAHTAAQAGGLR